MAQGMHSHRRAAATVAAFLSFIAAGTAPAPAFDGSALGADPGALPAPERITTAIRPFRVTSAAAVASGGTALRNLPGGGISIAGLPGKATEAWLYWAVITDGAPPAAASSILFRRELPSRTSLRTLPGTVVGEGASPCWDGDRITVFRARVPVAVAGGNGLYVVVPPPGVPGATDGSDPWAGSPLPAYEGASLVLIGEGPFTVSLYDAGFAGRTFVADPGLALGLALPAAIADSPHPLWMHLIGADGQDGFGGLSNIPTMSGEMTVAGGVLVGGPGSIRNDSDWNGSAGQPLTKLWDDRAADITHAKEPGARRLPLAFGQPGGLDCLTTVAVALQG